FGQGMLGLHIGGRAVAFLVVDLVHLLEQQLDAGEAFQRLGLELFELFGQRLGAAIAVVVIVGVELVEIFLGHIVVGFVRVGEAVHYGGDDNPAFADFIG